MSYVIVKYLHFVGILGLFSLLLLENFLVKPELTERKLARIARIDIVYWLTGVLAVVSGLLLTLVVGKSPSFYLSNPVFHLKVTLFAVAILATLYPTVFFLRHFRATGDTVVRVPRAAIMIMRGKVLVLMVLPFLGVLMAMGYGL